MWIRAGLLFSWPARRQVWSARPLVRCCAARGSALWSAYLRPTTSHRNEVACGWMRLWTLLPSRELLRTHKRLSLVARRLHSRRRRNESDGSSSSGHEPAHRWRCMPARCMKLRASSPLRHPPLVTHRQRRTPQRAAIARTMLRSHRMSSWHLPCPRCLPRGRRRRVGYPRDKSSSSSKSSRGHSSGG